MSDSEESDYAIPSRGVISSRKNRGWAGEDMEMAHVRASERNKNTAAAVDLKQFRNDEVGKGYQAKFVVRQRTADNDGATNAPSAVKDMTQKKSSSSDDKPPRKGKRKKGEKSHTAESSKGSTRLDKYLKSEALRRFRKELEKF